MFLTRLNRSRRGNHGQRGFTLTELMIALVIMGLIMSVVYKVFSSQDRFFRNQEQISSMQENLRATVEYINQELSWLGYKVPGIAVIKAAPADIIFKANIPNTGGTIQYVRYQFNPSTNTISRAAGAATTDIESVDLTVMASDIEALSFSYYNVLNGVVVTTAADPLCADELTSAVCSPGSPDDDASLLMVQRVKARITARTTRPDWLYTDPNGGPNPNFRKRKAVLDLRARNIEDVTLQGGQIVVGSCGYMTHTMAGPYSSYAACPDKTYFISNFRPSPDNNTWDDNPSVTIQAYDKDGNLNTNTNQVTYVYAVADDGTPYNIYDPADPFSVDNTIANGEIRYIAAQDLSKVATGTHVELSFAYSDGVCTQVSYDGDHDIIVAASAASQVLTSATMPDGLQVDYVDNGGSTITLGTPDKVAMCSSVGNERVLLAAQINDDCGNPISGEIVSWSSGAVGGTFLSMAEAGGVYSATWIPPDTLAGVAAEYTGTLSAQWGSFNPTVNVTVIAADAHDIVIDSIVDVTQAGIFQYTSNVLPRATQLGGNSGNSFAIERIDGQEVEITFHIEDACGNWVFDSLSINNSTTKGDVSGITNNGDGTHSFTWESNIGCGLEQLGEVITISTTAIANPSTQSETVSFDLLTTRSSDPLSGPFVRMDKMPIDGKLQAGNTSDSITIEATLEQYDPAKQYCTNLLAGSMSPFTMEFTVTGDVGGNGSFSPLSPFDDDTEPVSTDTMGIADVYLFSGTADWDDSLTVSAAVDVEGANYSGSMAVAMKETIHPQDDSGFYQDGLYTTEIGTNPDQTTTTFGPGDYLYLQIFDYDENEEPNAQEGISSPYDVEVTVESNLTGDVEVVGLTEELSGNSPQFRRTLQTMFYPAVATTLEKGDGVLQVRDGDTITMSYEDKDNPADADSWTVKTPGADSFRIYRVDGTDEFDLFSAGVQVEDVAYNDKLRPKLSLPFLAGDGRLDLDTVQITIDSGVDTDIVVLREDGDSGLMMPDDTVYAGKHFSVAQSDVSDAADILATPTTPRYVTLEYNVAGSYAVTLSFLMRDYDPPEVVITSPADTSTVSGQVTVLVDANDVGNATSWGGISRVELYINGRLYQTIVGADLSGSNSFTWTTAVGTTPYWLDGSHTLTARAFDTSNNEATSDPVGVTVDNNLSPIWFSNPAYNSIWSQDVDVQTSVSIAAESGTHQLLLYVNGSSAATFTVTGSGTFNHTVDTTLLPEGTADLIAIIVDAQTNDYQTTALDFIVDRTPPVINVGSPFDLAWINKAAFPLDVQATISDFRFAPADPNDVDDATVTATFSGECSSGTLNMTEIPAGSDTYTLSWANPACDDKEGILTITVDADDVASPPNQASRAFSVRLDTKKPTVDTLDVIPMVNQSFTMGSLTFDGFIRGDVTLQAGVTDGNLGSSIGAFTAWFYNDPYLGVGPPDGTQYLPLENYQSAASGTFTDLWPTTSYTNGIYILAAGVMDSAGNSSDSSPSKILYLDNNEPWINAPWLSSGSTTYLPGPGTWVDVVHGLVNVRMMADDWGGFLRTIEHRYVMMGDDPNLSGNVVNSVIYSFTADDKVRRYEKSYTINTCGVPAGAYDVYAYATDWAGNTAPVWSNSFVVEDWTFLMPPSAVDPVAYFTEDPPAANNEWWLESDGRFQNCSGPVDGLSVDVYFYKWNWNGVMYDPPVVYGTSGTTSAGDMPHLRAPTGTWTYTPTSLGGVEFVDPITSNIYAVFHPMTLSTPQNYDTYGTYTPWYTEFQPFNQERMLINVTYDLTPSLLPAHDLTLNGTMIFNSGYPAVGEPVTMWLNYNDPSYGATWQEISTVTDLSGKFTFAPSADISITDWISIDISHPSAYWSDTWMGWISWDPSMGTWSENLD